MDLAWTLRDLIAAGDREALEALVRRPTDGDVDDV